MAEYTLRPSREITLPVVYETDVPSSRTDGQVVHRTDCQTE